MDTQDKLKIIFDAVDLEKIATQGIDKADLQILKSRVMAKFPSTKPIQTDFDIEVPKSGLIEIYTDGASFGNPGKAGAGVLVQTSDREEIFTLAEPIGVATNNVAEYTALLMACQFLTQTDLKEKYCHFKLDSELVVKQINGIYKIKNPDLRDLNKQIQSELSKINAWKVSHVRREYNTVADKLSKEGANKN